MLIKFIIPLLVFNYNTSNSDNIDSYIDMGIDLLLYDTNQFVRDGITSLKNKIK